MPYRRSILRSTHDEDGKSQNNRGYRRRVSFRDNKNNREGNPDSKAYRRMMTGTIAERRRNSQMIDEMERMCIDSDSNQQYYGDDEHSRGFDNEMEDIEMTDVPFRHFSPSGNKDLIFVMEDVEMSSSTTPNSPLSSHSTSGTSIFISPSAVLPRSDLEQNRTRPLFTGVNENNSDVRHTSNKLSDDLFLPSSSRHSTLKPANDSLNRRRQNNVPRCVNRPPTAVRKWRRIQQPRLSGTLVALAEEEAFKEYSLMDATDPGAPRFSEIFQKILAEVEEECERGSKTSPQ